MVDMPHIRFGDETTGYEFPTSDGTAGQVMTTSYIALDEKMTTQEAMSELLEHFEGVEPGKSLAFRELFPPNPTRDRVVALFMGILQLMHIKAVRVVQSVTFGEIRISATPVEDD